MNEQMTIEELIERCSRLYIPFNDDVASPQSYRLGARAVIDLIIAHRPALEQKPLRFRKSEHGFWREIDLEGNWLHEDGIDERAVQYYNKKTAIDDCERRGIPCEFLEATSDENRIPDNHG